MTTDQKLARMMLAARTEIVVDALRDLAKLVEAYGDEARAFVEERMVEFFTSKEGVELTMMLDSAIPAPERTPVPMPKEEISMEGAPWVAPPEEMLNPVV